MHVIFVFFLYVYNAASCTNMYLDVAEVTLRMSLSAIESNIET